LKNIQLFSLAGYLLDYIKEASFTALGGCGITMIRAGGSRIF
jgi:hypothetical protein